MYTLLIALLMSAPGTHEPVQSACTCEITPIPDHVYLMYDECNELMHVAPTCRAVQDYAVDHHVAFYQIYLYMQTDLSTWDCR